MTSNRFLFFAGDCLAGAATGVAVTLAVRALVPHGFDMVAAMMVGMVIGTLVHLVVGGVLSPLLGMFETMVPGMFIGMYGGMLFGMRDSMQRVELSASLTVGALFGITVVVLTEFWNVQLRHQSQCSPGDADRPLGQPAQDMPQEVLHEPA